MDIVSALGDLTVVAQSKHTRLASTAALPMGRAVVLSFSLLILWKASLSMFIYLSPSPGTP